MATDKLPAWVNPYSQAELNPGKVFLNNNQVMGFDGVCPANEEDARSLLEAGWIEANQEDFSLRKFTAKEKAYRMATHIWQCIEESKKFYQANNRVEQIDFIQGLIEEFNGGTTGNAETTTGQ